MGLKIGICTVLWFGLLSAACPVNAKGNKIQLKLSRFQGEKSHAVVVSPQWSEDKQLDQHTFAAIARGTGSDANGAFTFVVTRIQNPEWTDYSLWISYDSGKLKNQTLRARWTTHGHEPPGMTEVADGAWTLGQRMGGITGSAE